MSTKLSLGIETLVFLNSGDYKEAGKLCPGDELMGVDSLPNRVLSVTKERAQTLFLSGICVACDQLLPVCPLPTTEQEKRIVDFCLFEPERVKAIDYDCIKHSIFRSFALWPHKDTADEAFVVGKMYSNQHRAFPEEYVYNDRKTRYSLLSGALMSEAQSPSFSFVCSSLGLDPSKKTSELLDDVSACVQCSLVNAFPERQRKSQVVRLRLEREIPIFVDKFVNI
ncbi:hypothetical protein GMAR_ORF38 [Golden Marseillevirus]|uniref:hypothetical protein n=1 Tax=Golden Marseillevirus TaxID=1720526 RepID=UPI000877AC67|nr:hypothetical protein GMAR_ORF38 [Golden Marseillevirus]ALX27413.1 hypothetical protein GMAR_ORF38 [Golden Marseillevirus]